jgi:hypothetical protein
MPRSLFVPLLLISCQLAAANYGVLDIFSSDADCATLGPVQASIRREVGICWNVPYGIPDMFSHPTMFDNKRVDDDVPPVTHPPTVQDAAHMSYRIESCQNTSPFLSASVSGKVQVSNQ